MNFFTRKGQWWDVVDEVAAHLLGGALFESKNMGRYLTEFVKDENMWVRRASIISQLRHKEKTDFELLSNLILCVAGEKEFFIRKAIGWSLRQYSYVNPSKVQNFVTVERENLSNLSLREALKAINRKMT